MKYITSLILSLFVLSIVTAQPNCEAFKYYGDTLKCQACKKAEEIKGHYQFSRVYQQKLGTFAYAYKEKSVAYLKSGDFITWKLLIDKAVKFDPKDNLGYRGWCRYQFFRDYEGAISDIERLDSLVSYDIGSGVNGDYHLNIAKAICYKAIGQNEKAIKIVENQINRENYYVGLFDYYHLGVWYFENNQLAEALIILEKQISLNDLAEVHYYIALIYKERKDFSNYEKQLKLSKEMYNNGKKMFDPYTHHFDTVYLKEIENEIDRANK